MFRERTPEELEHYHAGFAAAIEAFEERLTKGDDAKLILHFLKLCERMMRGLYGID